MTSLESTLELKETEAGDSAVLVQDLTAEVDASLRNLNAGAIAREDLEIQLVSC